LKALSRRCYSVSAIRRAASQWAVLPLASKALLAGVPAGHTVMVQDLRNRRSWREISHLKEGALAAPGASRSLRATLALAPPL
jgi:hypothetical protein